METRARYLVLGLLLLGAVCTTPNATVSAASDTAFASQAEAATPLPAPAAPVPSLACRMIEAAHCAYAVTAPGPLQPDKFCTVLAGLQRGRGFVGDRVKREWWQINKLFKGIEYRDAAYVAQYPAEVLVVFRGTQPFDIDDQSSVQDWANDANALPDEDREMGHVHSGFNHALNNVWTGVVAELQSWLKEPNWVERPIYVVGHSKGGALADLAALKFTTVKTAPMIPVKGVFTFAGARAGMNDFAAKYRKLPFRTERYENQFDVVPHLPPDADEFKALDKLPPLKGWIKRQQQYEAVGALHYVDENVIEHLPVTEKDRHDLAAQRVSRFETYAEQHLTTVLGQITEAHNITAPSAKADDRMHHRYYSAVCP